MHAGVIGNVQHHAFDQLCDSWNLQKRQLSRSSLIASPYWLSPTNHQKLVGQHCLLQLIPISTHLESVCTCDTNLGTFCLLWKISVSFCVRESVALMWIVLIMVTVITNSSHWVFHDELGIRSQWIALGKFFHKNDHLWKEEKRRLTKRGFIFT